MKRLALPNTNPILQVVILLACLDYSTVLAAIVFEDARWGPAILRGVPLALLMFLAWLLFRQFKVLRKTYYFLAVSFLAIWAALLISSSGIDSEPFIQVPYYPFVFEDHDTATFIFAISKELHRTVFIGLPLFVFAYYLLRGFANRCPKCNLADGLYNKEITNTNELGSYTRPYTRTSEKREYDHFKKEATITKFIENGIERVTKYEVFYTCKYGHKWSIIKESVSPV